jgi:NitT/TauT family transport system permease protein
MHHSIGLHRSKRYNIFKHNYKSALISWGWILLAVIIIGTLIVVSGVHLDISQIFAGFVASLLRTTIAYFIAATIAILIALLITSHKTVEDIFLPIFDVLQSFPSFALFPILVVALKDSPETVIIFVLTITMIWPILFSIISGIKNRRQDFEEAATIFGARGIKRLIYFTLPELWPSIVTGSIVGWGEGWEFIIGAELLVKVNPGIGTYLGGLGQNQQSLALAAGIAILLILLFILNKILWLPLLNRSTEYSEEG